MIRVDSQYWMTFSLGGRRDFISEPELDGLVLVEEAGTLLPTFQLEFRTRELGLARELHEGTTLTVALGKGEESHFMVRLCAMYVASKAAADGEEAFIVKGMLDQVKFLNDVGVGISSPCSGLEEMRRVSSEYFEWNSELIISEDSQRWIRPGITAKAHLNQVWMHTNLGTDIPAVGICIDGSYRVRGLRALREGTPRWRFSNIQEELNRDLAYSAMPEFEMQSGLTNAWYGYGRTKCVLDLVEGTEESLTSSLSGELIRRSDVGARADRRGAVSENVDPLYWETFQKNLMGLAVQSTLKAKVTLMGVNPEMRILDLVLLVLPGMREKEADDTYSGKYVVTKVVRQKMGKVFATFVEMCRASVLDPRGSLR